MTTLLLECDWHIGGKGETFFHEKKSRTSAPVFPSPNHLSLFKKSGVFLLPLVAAGALQSTTWSGSLMMRVREKGLLQNLVLE